MLPGDGAPKVAGREEISPVGGIEFPRVGPPIFFGHLHGLRLGVISPSECFDRECGIK